MNIKRLMAGAVLSAGLSSAVLAEDAPEIKGSEQTIAPLDHIKEDLLALAGEDIFVLSRPDFFTRDEILKLRVFSELRIPTPTLVDVEGTMNSISNTLFRNRDFLDMLPQAVSYKKLGMDFKPFADKLASNAKAAELVEPIITSSPVALRDYFEGACIIVAPEIDLDPAEMIASLAGFPSSMNGMVKTSATSEEIYELIMRHEARHCAQERAITDNTIQNLLDRLEGELDADEHAFEGYRIDHQDDPARTEQIINEFRFARALANIRNGGTYYDSPEYNLSHGTATFTETVGLGDMEINGADITLGAKLLNTAISYMMGAQMNLLFDIMPEAKAINDKYDIEDDGLYLSGDIIISANVLRHEEPLLEYAFIKAAYITLSENEKFQEMITHEGFPHIARLMVADYLTAFETLVPDAQEHPMVKAQMELSRNFYQKFATIAVNDTENTTQDGAQIPNLSNECKEAAGDVSGKSSKQLQILETIRKCIYDAELQRAIELEMELMKKSPFLEPPAP